VLLIGNCGFEFSDAAWWQLGYPVEIAGNLLWRGPRMFDFHASGLVLRCVLLDGYDRFLCLSGVW